MFRYVSAYEFIGIFYISKLSLPYSNLGAPLFEQFIAGVNVGALYHAFLTSTRKEKAAQPSEGLDSLGRINE